MTEQKFINLLSGMKNKISEAELKALVETWNFFEKTLADMQLQRDEAAYKAVQYKDLLAAQESVYEDHLRRIQLFYRVYERTGNPEALQCIKAELTTMKVYRKIEFELLVPLITDQHKFLN